MSVNPSPKGEFRPHHKYGNNPTQMVCIMCGKDKEGAVALLGDSILGEAPARMIMDHVPCDACLKKLIEDNAVCLVDTTEEGTKITGRYITVKDQGYREMFSKEPPVGKVALLRQEHFETILSWMEEAK